MGDKWVREKEDLPSLVVGSCRISYCWVNFWSLKKSVSHLCPLSKILMC